jgi:hypothetical protein
MRLALSFLAICLLGTQTVAAADAPALSYPPKKQAQATPSPVKEAPSFPTDAAQVGTWMTYYYLTQDAAHVPDFLKWLQTSELLKDDARKPAITAFLTALFQGNPKQVASWIKAEKFTEKTRDAIVYSLWESGNTTLIKTLLKDAPAYTAKSPTPLFKRTPTKPSDLDAMWGAFIASGKPDAILNIINALDDSKSPTGDKTKDSELRRAAEWSLTQNAPQHEVVERILRSEAKKRTASVQKSLTTIQETIAKSRKPFPNKTGEFSAVLALLDEKAIALLAKPAEKDVQLKEVTRLKKGEEVAIKILFMGMELTPDLHADVTFDLKLLTPKGTLYKNGDIKKILALNTRVPSRFRVFDSQSFPKIRFAPEDALGKYKIIAELHDNVSKKSIKLQRELELVK